MQFNPSDKYNNVDRSTSLSAQVDDSTTSDDTVLDADKVSNISYVASVLKRWKENPEDSSILSLMHDMVNNADQNEADKSKETDLSNIEPWQVIFKGDPLYVKKPDDQIDPKKIQDFAHLLTYLKEQPLNLSPADKLKFTPTNEQLIALAKSKADSKAQADSKSEADCKAIQRG